MGCITWRHDHLDDQDADTWFARASAVLEDRASLILIPSPAQSRRKAGWVAVARREVLAKSVRSLAFEGESQAGREERGEVDRPDLGAVAAEVDGVAVGYVE